MAIIVEDGTGLETSNSYISEADADTYHSDRGNSAWAEATSTQKQAALIKACQWLDAVYGKRWLGSRSKYTQGLDWPRVGAVDHDGYSLYQVPKKLPWAAAEAALAIIGGVDLSPVLERGGKVRREKIGSLETEYSDGAPARTVVTAVTDMVRTYLRGSGLRITL